MKITTQTIAAIGILFCLGACAPKSMTDSSSDASTYFPIQIGEQLVQLQLALGKQEQSKGLMHRELLELSHGMLFLFKTPKRQSFWMRNTPLKLDIGYFNASGVLMETHSLYPFDETAVKSFSADILIAIEMNHGWFAKNKVRPGARIDLAQLKDALRERGQPINDYALNNLD